jgi:hypothetical protein
MRRFRAIIFSITLFASTALGLLGPAAASAQSIQNAVDPQSTAAPAGYQMQIPIPVSPLEQGVSNAGVGVVSDVSQYIGRIYYFAIGIVGLVAAVMMIIGGFQYLTSAGDTAKIGAAKKRITDAIIGLVLMLGSYALLNTINPALLAFRPLSALIAENEIKTQLNFIPFCEDLRDPNDPKLPQPVEALADSADCGTLGTYTLEKGVSYCIMRGDCGERQIKTVGIKDPYWGTCFQKSGLTPASLEAIAKGTDTKTPLSGTGKNSKVAECLPCFGITTSVAKEMGYYGMDSACDAWATTRNNQFTSEYTPDNGYTNFAKDQRNRFWSYCSAAEKFPTCVQADVDCHAVNRNSNDRKPGVTGAIGFVAKSGAVNSIISAITNCERKNTCGCEGYNDSPAPLWSTVDSKLETLLHGGAKIDGDDVLDAYPKHLTEMCVWNPCLNYVDPETKDFTFEKGCKGGDGIVSSVARYIGHQDLKMTSCENQ